MPNPGNDELFQNAPDLKATWNDVCRLQGILDDEAGLGPKECGPAPEGTTNEGLQKEYQRLEGVVDALAASYDNQPPEKPPPKTDVPMM